MQIKVFVYGRESMIAVFMFGKRIILVVARLIEKSNPPAMLGRIV